jgi:hypothetical protein
LKVEGFGFGFGDKTSPQQQQISGDTKKKSKFGANLWYRFFSENRGMVTIYWKELKEEKERQIIEKMLELVLLQSIEFEEFKRKCKEGN